MLTARLLLMAIPLMVATAGTAVTAGPGGSDDAVAARVNGRAIYLSQLKPNIDETVARYKKYGAGDLSAQTKQRIQKEELDRQVGLELLAQAGERVVGGEIEAKVDQSVKGKKVADADRYRKQVRRKLLIDGYLAKKGVQDLRIPETELKRYYQQNRQSFKQPESVRVSHILVMLPKNPTPEQIAKARKEIENIRQEALRGVSFAQLAQEHSRCASAKAGGDLGYITPGYMPREFDRVAFALKEGAISDAVRTRHGFHIIKAGDRKPQRIQEFAEVKDLIEKFLIQRVQSRKIDQIVDDLRREAKVELFLGL